MKNRAAIGVLCAVGCEVLYGASFVFTKSATGEVSALTLLGWRFLFAFAVMSILVAVRLVKVNYKGRNVKKLLFTGLLFPVIYFIGETVGIDLTTASESGTIIAGIPIVSLAASAVFLKKKPEKIQMCGVCVSLAGVLVTVLGVGVKASFSFAGYGMLMLAVVTYALYCVCVDKSPEFTGGEITYIMLGVGAAVFTAAALIEGVLKGSLDEFAAAPFENPDLLKALLYQGLGCSIAAFFMSNVALAYIGVNRVSSFIGVNTVVSILSGVLILHESFTLMQVIGAAVILTGVYIANFGNLNNRRRMK